LQWVASEAGLEEDDWSVMFLGTSPGNYDSLIRQLVTNAVAPAPTTRGGDLFAMTARQREVLLGQLVSDAKMLGGTEGVQAYCLECPAEVRPVSRQEGGSLVQWIGAWIAD
jgi:protease-4